MKMNMSQWFPILKWGRTYTKKTFANDAVASVVITMTMIPQSLAYALLAGLPPQLGLYASILPLLLYALFGSSSALSVGPFAISSIMTATALSAAFPSETLNHAHYVAGAVVLAFSSGLFLVAFGLLRLGFLSNFLSFPVVIGFISASAIVIGASQIGNLLGIKADGGALHMIFTSVFMRWHEINIYTLSLGVTAFLFLYYAPKQIKKLSLACGAAPFLADILAKITPIIAMGLSVLFVFIFNLEAHHVAVVGHVPAGIAALGIPDISTLNWRQETWKSLIGSSVLISSIGVISSVTIAQTFAAKRRQRIDPNQEAIGLGMANLGSGFSGSFPVAASLSRSAVSFMAGAETPAAGAFTALGIATAAFFLTPYLYHLPITTLAAMILVTVISLINVSAIKRTWRYSTRDFSTLAITGLLTLFYGVEWGLVCGVALSIALHLYQYSHPHMAVVGQVPGTEHFRNVLRHRVLTHPDIITLRVDASLYFVNARFLEDKINELVAKYPEAKHLVLMCSAINSIDTGALESLFAVNEYLQKANMQLHLSEVKGPVLDSLKNSDFLEKISGNIYLTQHQAWQALIGDKIISQIDANKSGG